MSLETVQESAALTALCLELRTCNKCGVAKPLSEFYASRTRKDGLQRTCKECSSRIGKEWCKNNQARTDVVIPLTKVCLCCGVESF
jgi:hypothetical protein